MTFIPVRITESSESFQDWQEVLFLRAALINHRMFLEFRDLPEVERLAEIQRLTDKLCEMSH